MRTTYIILLILWIIGSIFWSKSTFCGKTAKKKPAAEKSVSAVPAATGGTDCDRSLVFNDGDFSASSENNFMFLSGQTKFKKPEGTLDESLKELSTYLGDNADRSVLIEGIYFDQESDDSAEENLGIRRASAVKTHLVNRYGVDADQLKVGGRLTSNLKCFFNKDSKLVTKGLIATFGEK